MAKPNITELEAENEALRRENTELREANRAGEKAAQAEIERLTRLLSARAEAVAELRPFDDEPAAPRLPRAKYVIRCRAATGETLTLRPGDLIPEGADTTGIDPSAIEG